PATDAANNEDPSAQAELLPFTAHEYITSQSQHIPFAFPDYVQLVDWTGRAVRDDKRGAIDMDLPPILQRLGMTPRGWLTACCHIENRFGRAIGSPTKIATFCERIGQRWIQGIRQCRRLYSLEAT